MTEETLEKAKACSVRITELSDDLRRISGANSDNFKERSVLLNILGNRQDDGWVTVPKSVMKKVCEIVEISIHHHLLSEKEKFKNL